MQEWQTYPKRNAKNFPVKGGSPCRNDDYSINKTIAEYKCYSGWVSMAGMVGPHGQESTDTSITNSKQLEVAIPVNKISSLSSGEFVGMVADNPDQKIELKSFCSEIINDHEALVQEQTKYKELPQFSKVNPNDVLNNYLQVKKDVGLIVQGEIERMLDTPELTDLIIRKETT